MFKSLVSVVTVLAFACGSLLQPVQAAMLETEVLASERLREQSSAQIQQWLARAEVQAQLTAWGVSAEQAEARVAALSEEERLQLAQVIEQEPAAGDVVGIVGVVFIVLMILELVGVTNIFTSF